MTSDFTNGCIIFAYQADCPSDENELYDLHQEYGMRPLYHGRH